MTSYAIFAAAQSPPVVRRFPCVGQPVEILRPYSPSNFSSRGSFGNPNSSARL
jgi:hypothetical protein